MRLERAERKRWPMRLGSILAATMLLMACGEEPEPELSGRFGPGSGDPALSGDPNNYVPVSITKSSGAVVGIAEYDSSFFVVAAGSTAEGEFENLADDPTNPTLVVTLTRITGRPDTPCRFQAAILERDEGYEILESGDRENSRDLDFYQVNLKQGFLRLSLFCATLRGDVGVAVQVIAGSAALIKSEQVHFILNSIRKS